VERAGFIGESRYVRKQKMRRALRFFGRWAQAIEFSARYWAQRFDARASKNRGKGLKSTRCDQNLSENPERLQEVGL
jgi:hypothetical protein